MKYKVGDKVKVRSDLKAYEIYGSNMLTKSMEKFAGKTVTISGVGITSYAIEEMGVAYWTDEMLEPVEELTAEEAIRILGGMCRDFSCCECPIYELIEDEGSCDNLRAEKPDKVIEVLKQWKKDHEKKPIETEFIYIVRIIEDKQCVHEEEIVGESEDEAQERVLKKYCEDHKGKFYAVAERICRVKE